MTDVLERLDQLEECFERGYQAYCKGLAKEECPFLRRTVERQHWLGGWESARSEQNDAPPED